MHKKSVVRLTDEEREELQLVIKKWKGLGQKVRRTQVLLKADVDGPGWTDEKTGEAYGCRVQAVENVRRRLVSDGFELALKGVPRQTPPTLPFWMARRRRRSSRLGWGNLRRGLVAGRCGCSRNTSSSWRSSSPSVTQRSAKFSKYPPDEAQGRVRGH